MLVPILIIINVNVTLALRKTIFLRIYFDLHFLSFVDHGTIAPS